MLKKTAISMMTGLLMWAAVSCNSSSTDTTVLPSTALVTSFYIRANDSIITGLDSVYFSIDLISGKIFNADSLPCGTPIDRLVPAITVNSASAIEIIEPRPGRTDSIHDYIEHSGDTIDFSNGPVGLRVKSFDGSTTYNYKITVNVHKQHPDSMVWSNKFISGVPSQWPIVNDQRTVAQGVNTFTLSTYESQYCITKASGYDVDSYTKTSLTPNFGFTPNLRSFSATDDRLYILDTAGNLYFSTDEGANWTNANVTWNNIYGNYATQLIGSKKDGDRWYRVTYPDLTIEEIPANFPVSGASIPVTYTWLMSTSKQLIITGGRLADNTLSADTWAYDGNTWLRITKTPLPEGLENMSVFPYFVTKADSTTWRVTNESALFAMYGNRADGSLNNTLYISNDFGMHWEKAPINLQPGAFPPRTDAQAYVLPAMLGTRSRAVAPITEWQCPYVYIFGGYSTTGQLYNAVLRGVINRLQDKPLQ